MFRLEPVGRARWSRSARTSRARSRSAAGGRGVRARARRARGRDVRGRRVHAADGGVPRRLRVGDRRRREQPPPAAREGRATCPRSSRSFAARARPRERRMAAPSEVVFAGTDGGALTDIDAYEAAGGFRALAKARAMAPDDVIEELNASQPARPGRRLLPDRAQVELRARSRSSSPSRTTSSSTPTSPSRGRSRIARSCCACPSASSRAA